MTENGFKASPSNPSYPLPYKTPSHFQSLPAALPTLDVPVSSFPSSSSLEDTASRLLDSLHRTANASESQTRLFTTATPPIFRDTFALTSTLRTFYCAPSILTAWQDTTSDRKATNFSITPDSTQTRHLGGDVGWIDVRFTFSCDAEPKTKCEGWLSLVPESTFPVTNGATTNGNAAHGIDWKIWLVRTLLIDLVQTSPLSVNILNPITATNGSPPTNVASPINHKHLPTTSPSALVIGAGPAGLSLSSRFLALDIPHLVLSHDPPSAGIGSSWKIRYDSAKLHTIREYSHLPYERTFTADGYGNREWMGKDDLAVGYAGWAGRMGVDQHVRLGWEVVHASWIAETKSWDVQVRWVGEGENSSSAGHGPTSNGTQTTNHTSPDNSEIKTIQCAHIILATGPGAHHPSTPVLPNRPLFPGTTLHSATYHTSTPWRGLRGLIIGTANTAHDIAADMTPLLARVTMLQRRTTYVLPTEYFSSISARSYNAAIPTDDADKAGSSMPWCIARLMAMRGLHAQVKQEESKGEKSRFQRLQRAGYAVEKYGDIMWHIVERMGGHYMDMGNCENISDGKVKMKHGVPVEWSQKGLIVDTGHGNEEIEADVVVFATGFERGGKRDVERMFDDDVARQCEEYWGLDEEGEIRGAWKGSGHPGLWYHGGTLGHVRYMSRFIALRIRAELDGVPLPVYSLKV